MKFMALFFAFTATMAAQYVAPAPYSTKDTVYAYQFTGTPDSVSISIGIHAYFVGPTDTHFSKPTPCRTCGEVAERHGEADNTIMCPGDWLVWTSEYRRIVHSKEFTKKYKKLQ